MDVALYEKLLEDVRSDLDQSAPKLAELQSVQAFLERRLATVSDADSYQKVFDDISTDIERETRSVSELERIDRFVSGKLGKPGYTPSVSLPKVEATPATRTEPKPQKPAAKPPRKMDEDTKDEPPAERLENLPGDRSGMTIEFGPDGFPISSDSKGKSGKDSKMATVSHGMDGATVNFGPDGFPLDVPNSSPKR